MAVSVPQRSRAASGDSDAGRQPESATARRLIVPVSEADWNDAEFPRRIWTLAAPHGSPVVLLGLYPEAAAQAHVRRQLVSLAAAIRDSQVSVEIRTQPGNNWVQQVEAIWRPGDLVICTLPPAGGRALRPASQILRSGLPIPLYVLSGEQAAERARASLPLRLVSWGGNLGILAGFLWLQVWLAQLPGEVGRIALLLLSLLVEVQLLWIWNSLTA
ncbi:MAG TPA: hypothetical protein VJ123_05925 [Anaerolineales bacterium]|nr:hypothetical protein [Anaerolineales bacterium]